MPVHQEFERGALDPPYGHEVLAYLSGGQRDEPRQDRSPGQVDDLPGLGGVRELLVGVGEVVERVLDLPLGEGAELRPADYVHVGSRLADGLHADQLSLPVVVGRDDDLVGLGREVLDRVEDGLHPDGLNLRCVHQIHRGRAAPVVVLLGIVQLDDVSPEAHDVVVVAPGLEGYHRHTASCGGVGLSVRKNRGDPPCGVGLLGDNQLSHQFAGRPQTYLMVIVGLQYVLSYILTKNRGVRRRAEAILEYISNSYMPAWTWPSTHTARTRSGRRPI